MGCGASPLCERVHGSVYPSIVCRHCAYMHIHTFMYTNGCRYAPTHEYVYAHATHTRHIRVYVQHSPSLRLSLSLSFSLSLSLSLSLLLPLYPCTRVETESDRSIPFFLSQHPNRFFDCASHLAPSRPPPFQCAPSQAGRSLRVTREHRLAKHSSTSDHHFAGLGLCLRKGRGGICPAPCE